MKKCIIDDCSNTCEKGRRYCKEHYLERKRAQAKERYKNNGRYTYKLNCTVCGKSIDAFRRDQRFCKECYNIVRKLGSCGKNNYENAHGDGYCWLHRRIAEAVLRRKLSTNEIVHHLNGNPKDNDVTNLIVLSRAKHAALHNYLRMQGALLLKDNNENFENCWNNLIVPMTTTWLETANVKVIKLWEIGQSAAEPLLNGEGSETMHEAAKHDVHADDIVQTTTSN